MNLRDAPFRVGQWRVNPALDEICRDGTTVKLEPRTMRVLMCLAEHGGEVVLLSSYPGETIFQMTVAREIQPPGAPTVSGTDAHDEVNQHENLRA